MFAHRVFVMRPALYSPVQVVRGFGWARVALEPAKKAAPPPPPPPPAKKSAAAAKRAPAAAPAAVAATPAASKKATPAKLGPALTKTAIDKDKTVAANAKDKAKEKEKLIKAKEKEREKREKAKEREKAKKEKAKEREKEKKAKAKEREKLKAEQAKAKERQKLKAEKEKPYPPPPKRPATGYVLFAHDPNVKRDKSENVTEAAIKAGEAWRALSEAEREAYNKKSEIARAQWREDVAKWVSSLNLAQLTAARANREPGTRDEAAMEALPKRPGNAYALFLADVYKRQDVLNKVEALAQKNSGGDENKARRNMLGLMGRTSADIWKNMSEKEKAVYTNRAADAKKQWDKDFGSLVATQKEALAAAHA